MYYISVPENSTMTEKKVIYLKPITFKELPDIQFIIFKDINTKYWNITEVETGLKVTSGFTKEEVINFVIKNAGQIIKAKDYYKQNLKSFKKIPLVNQESQITGPAGAKLHKVLTYEGIKKKFLVEYKEIQGIKFYTQVNKQKKYDYAFVEVNNHFVNVGHVCNCENIADRIITENIDIHQWIEDSFNQSLNSSQCVFLGFAEYLGRLNEGLEHNKKVYEQAQEKQRQREEEKKRKEEEREQREEKEIIEWANKFANDEEVSGKMFVRLCDKYDIKLPLRTRGWCLNNLCKISSKTYSYYGKNRSTVIMDYVRKLKETITETNKLLTA